MAATYDDIAEQYQKTTTELLYHRYSDQETYFHALGDLSGESILDLACGEGRFTRKLKQKGAKRVIGVDISKEMIELAMEKERMKPLGIEYRVRDVLELGQIGKFNIVTAAYLLNYARTREDLLKMCQNIFLNLKSGNRFVTINNNNEESPDSYPKIEKYGYTKSISGPIEEGVPITVTLKAEGQGEVSFDNYYLTNATYKSVFREVGFKEIIWHPVRISSEGIRKFGQEYWRDFLQNPSFVCIECVK
uniref:Ubiquinone/menaquinone biosynthesis C-methylase UbiE n=1 Tax=Candidatus Kentrum sp. MB TaxID=2138164 RepID=A0A450XYV5_9GAMM|nr:MAG: Ubiquinone/menaquinone biosynthesis C-methylase UbiE [Candidatus Kentron sp. MB]VFK76757.1 MAG: Ubiquinone/menaquinone biosynthesis C-methylase UbiE [Candidatus Kentron sp. MB]